MESVLHEKDQNPNSVGYDHLAGTEPFPTGSPEWVEFEAHYRKLSQADSPDSQRGSNKERPPTKPQDSDYWELRESRPVCRRPKGLKMMAGPHSEYAVVRCQLCEGCKSWARMLDELRLAESIPKPVWFEVSDDGYENLRHKIKAAGVPYFSAPLEHERRAVIVGAEFRPTAEDGKPIPVESIEDMAALLSRFDHQRDRTEGRSGRRVSTGRMRSRKDLEQEVYQGTAAEKPEKVEREVTGTFNPPHQDTAEGPEWLGKLCDSIGVEWERSPFGILVSDTEPLDKALKVRGGHATWRQEEPPPEFYDQRALWTEPPEIPERYQDFRKRLQEAAA